MPNGHRNSYQLEFLKKIYFQNIAFLNCFFNSVRLFDEQTFPIYTEHSGEPPSQNS